MRPLDELYLSQLVPMLASALPVLPAWLCVQADYEARNYDAKKANGYWQLGRLGPEETEELQAKVRHRDMAIAVHCLHDSALLWHIVAACGCAAVQMAADWCNCAGSRAPCGSLGDNEREDSYM